MNGKDQTAFEHIFYICVGKRGLKGHPARELSDMHQHRRARDGGEQDQQPAMSGTSLLLLFLFYYE